MKIFGSISLNAMDSVERTIPSLKDLVTYFISSQTNEPREILRLPTELKDYIILMSKPIEFLCEAIKNGNCSVVLFALAYLDLTITTVLDEQESLPLHYACEHGQQEIVKLLIRLGVDKEAQNEGGETPLHVACYFGHAEVVEQLIALGANREVQDEQGETPAHFACLNDYQEIAKSLIKRGANVNAENAGGETVLHYATGKSVLHSTCMGQEGCTKYRRSIIELLMAAGASLDALDFEGKTALERAVDDEIKEFLRSKGA